MGFEKYENVTCVFTDKDGKEIGKIEGNIEMKTSLSLEESSISDAFGEMANYINKLEKNRKKRAAIIQAIHCCDPFIASEALCNCPMGGCWTMSDIVKVRRIDLDNVIQCWDRGQLIDDLTKHNLIYALLGHVYDADNRCFNMCTNAIRKILDIDDEFYEIINDEKRPDVEETHKNERLEKVLKALDACVDDSGSIFDCPYHNEFGYCTAFHNGLSKKIHFDRDRLYRIRETLKNKMPLDEGDIEAISNAFSDEVSEGQVRVCPAVVADIILLHEEFYTKNR